MARKIKWEINEDGHIQGIVVAPTRAAALGIAEAQWIKTWGDCIEDWTDEDGTIVAGLVMPHFIARKCESDQVTL